MVVLLGLLANRHNKAHESICQLRPTRCHKGVNGTLIAY